MATADINKVSEAMITLQRWKTQASRIYRKTIFKGATVSYSWFSENEFAMHLECEDGFTYRFGIDLKTAYALRETLTKRLPVYQPEWKDNPMTAQEQFDKLYSHTSAYVISRDARLIGKVVVRHAAITKAFVQICGLPMQIGTADGAGYDKETAAVSAAMTESLLHVGDKFADGGPIIDATRKAFALAIARAAQDDHRRWYEAVKNIGFEVHAAI